MKKTLAILLSLALVICMIPATASVAFAASGTGTVTIGSESYNVTVSETEYTYDGTVKNPTVTVTGLQADQYTVSYKVSNTVTPLVAAGTYDIYVTKSVETEAKVSGCQIVINKATVSADAIMIKQIDGKTLPEDGSITASEYFEVYFGGQKLSADDVELSSSFASPKYTVTATSKNKNYNDFTKIDYFYLVTDIGKVEGGNLVYSITPTDESITYTGSKLNPVVTVQKGSETALTVGQDYTVSCGNEINAGETVNITIKGIGRYTGSVSLPFEIKQRAIDDAQITVENTTVLKNQQPALVLKYNGRTLVKGTDYSYGTVTTSSTGPQTVAVTGMGNFKGSMNVAVNVTDSTTDLAAATLTTSGNLTYNNAAQAPTFYVKIGSTDVNPLYYTVKYKLNGSTAAATETKPTNVGTYDVEITAKTSNAGNFTGTKTFTSAFRIDPLDINSSSVSATFTGSPSYNPVKLQLGSKVLTWSIDYDVESYSSYKPYYTVTGKGNFKGTRLVYTATRNLSSCTVNFTDNRSSVAYGSTYYPDVTVYYGSTKLVKNSDYTVTYKNPSNQTVTYCRDTGTYSVIVTGTGAYTGTKTLYFTITGTDISGYTVTLKNSSVNATGYSQTPVITSVKKGYYYSLTSNDYTVSYQDSNGKTVYSMSAPGTYRVVVTGKNGYSGSTSTTFKIVGLTQTVTVEKDSYKVYPTSDYFKITAKASGEYSGFTYTSSNPAVASVSSAGYVTPKKVGRAVITVTAVGKNKYESASKTVEVKVYPNKAKISKKPWTDGKKAQMKVRWGYQDGVTKYQVRYSRDKNFKSGTYLTKTVKAHGKDYTTQSTTLSNLKRGYTYYIKVRAVYTDPVTGDNYYGSWSPWRSARTR